MSTEQVTNGDTPGPAPAAPMAFERLVLSNIGGFRSLDLTFHPRLTVLCGVNGAGKTTVLRALDTFLEGLASSIPAASGELTVRRMRLAIPGESQFQEVFPASLCGSISFGGTQHELRIDDKYLRVSPMFVGDEASMGAAQSWRDGGPRLIAHYGTGRVKQGSASVGDVVAAALTTKPTPDDVNKDWWSPQTSIATFSGWLAVQHLLQQQSGARPHLLDYADDVIAKLIPGARSAIYDFAEKELVLSFVDGQQKLASLLSDGERSLLAIAGDLLTRVGRIHGDLQLEQLRNSPGIVLIDELDLSLHPGWQQKVTNALLHAFPAMQFIVTSHSPTLISTVDNECVRILDRDANDDGIVTIPTFTNGAEANVLLERLFGVDPRWPDSELAKQLNEYDAMLSDGRWDTDEGRQVFERIREVSHNEEPEIGRLIAAQRLAAYRSKQ